MISFVKDPRKLYELWNLAARYSTRPSELLGISCDIQAFYLDRACWAFGVSLDSQMEQATKNAKNDVARKTAAQQIMNRVMGLGQEGKHPSGGGGFRDPAIAKG